MRSSKMYMHQIQLFGGKAAVLFNDISRWFAGLWQGTALALTVAWLSVGAAAVLFLAARFVEERDSG
jgi:hypothetical protein